MRRTSASLVLLLLLSCGCGHTRATRHYTLVAALEAAAEIPPVPDESGVSRRHLLFVERVTVAPYLRRPQLVLQEVNSPEVVCLDYARWASPIEDEVTAALLDELRKLLGPACSVLPAATDGPAGPRLRVAIDRLDAVPGVGARLDARWRLLPAAAADDGREAPHEAHWRAALADAEPAAVIAAHRANLRALAARLAAASGAPLAAEGRPTPPP